MSLLENPNPYVEKAHEAQTRLLNCYATGRPLSPREIVEHSLPLANVGLPIDEIKRVIEFLRGHSGISASAESNEIVPLGPSSMPMHKRVALGRGRALQLTRRLWTEVGEYSDWFRESLQSIMLNREAARESLQQSLAGSLDDIAVIPRLSWNGSALNIDMFYFWTTISGLFGYVLMTLLDETLGLGEALRVCKYDACERLFLSFSPATGGPRPSYCSPKHREDALREGGAARVARYRKLKARKSK